MPIYAKDIKITSTTSNPVQVTNAVNLGGANSHGVYAGTENETLQFRDIQGGSGITVTSDNNSIVISSNIPAGSTSVSGDYRIIIDNANQNPDAKFEIFTSASSDQEPLVISPTIILPLVVSDVYSGVEDGFGIFYATNGTNFYKRGFRAGMWVQVSNAGNQSGLWQIANVVTENRNGNNISKMMLAVPFDGDAAYNIGGPKPNVSFQQVDLIFTETSVSSYEIDFSTTGLGPGAIIEIYDNGTIEGVFTINEVIPKGDSPFAHSKLIVSENTPFPYIGAITKTIALVARNFERTTGFSVDKVGCLTTPMIRADNVLVGDKKVATECDVNVIERRTRKPITYFHAML